MRQLKVAILYQLKVAPSIQGIVKPMKEGGYSDSGADIAIALMLKNINVITPNKNPDRIKDFDWVFPDSIEGIEKAIQLGANTFWLNTVLFSSHPILKFKGRNLFVVGQIPEKVDRFDDKFYTNNLLLENNLPIPRSFLMSKTENAVKLDFPFIVKPIRGRGSQGVSVVKNEKEVVQVTSKLIDARIYGSKLIGEELLPGTEITISIMPPGTYIIDGKSSKKRNHWALPVVERFNHKNYIVPYNGIVAVVNNSQLMTLDEKNSIEIKSISEHCEIAAKLVEARAPIRVDCRKNKSGEYRIFDLNLKPNMTGASRPYRKDQNSLTMIAAEAIGWTYLDLIENLLNQRWML